MKQALWNFGRTMLSAMFIFSSIQNATAQEECIAVPSTQQYRVMQNQVREYETYITTNSPGAVCRIPIRAYIIADSYGYGALGTASLNVAIAEANRNYAALNMTFYIKEVVRVNSSYLYNFDSSKEDYLMSRYYKTGVINAYFTNLNGACGYAHFPGDDRDMIVVDNNCATNGSTFSHELGHFFSLLHTHETAFGAEVPNGDNCSTAGDLICDTPADPNLSGKVSSSCTYNGNRLYNPDARNLMSYSQKQCRNRFSAMQRHRILGCLYIDRPYLLECNQAPSTPCENATELQCNVPVWGNTQNGNNNFTSTDYRNCYATNSSFNGNDKLYKFTLNTTTKINLRLSQLWADLDVFLLSSCDPVRCLAYSVNSDNYDEFIQATLPAGTYYIIVDGYQSSEASSFRLDLQCESSLPETCPQAIPVTCGRTVSGNTAYGTAQLNIDSYRNCYASNSTFSARELVYKVQVNYTSILDLTLYGHSRDLDMFLLTSCQPTPRCVAYSTNSYNNNERIRVQVPPGTYYIAVDGYTAYEEGSFNLSVSCSNYVQGEEVAELSSTPGEKPALSELPSLKTDTRATAKHLDVHNEPNPFSGQTAIVFELPSAMKVDLLVFDVQGRKIHQAQEEFAAGINRWDFVASANMAAGVYYYRIQGEGFVETKSMVLSK